MRACRPMAFAVPRVLVLVLVLGGSLWGSRLAGAAEAPVDLELVLAVDVSGSVDSEEARLQRNGYVQALMNAKVRGAIRGGPFGRIAATYVEWAGEDHQTVVVGWTELSDDAGIERFAAAIAEAPAMTAQWTSISAAIDFAAPLFDGNGFEGTRRVIDVSGDGENNRGRPVEMAREAAVARGITINGLPILNDRPNPWGGAASNDLEGYYRDHVIGGPGAFLVPARDFDAFADAILAKLLLEVSGLMPSLGPPEWSRRELAER